MYILLELNRRLHADYNSSIVMQEFRVPQMWIESIMADIARVESFLFQLPDVPFVPSPDHLVKEEIIEHRPHLTHHGSVATQPYIRLLCSGRIKSPFPIPH